MEKKDRRTFSQFINAWLDEPTGETFRHGKWRFWFLALTGFSILNAALTAVVFKTGGNLQTYMGGVLLGVGAMLAWLGVGALHYSDSNDSRLARGVSALDSVALVFVIGHFAFLLWVYGHLATLQSAEADYKAATEKFNVEAKEVSQDNVRIAEAARQIAAETTKAERLRNDTAYQTRKAAEAGARFSGRRSGPSDSIGTSLSTAPIELERPTKPAQSSTEFLTKWDWWVRMANFGELFLAAITLIYIRNRSAATNARSAPVEEKSPDYTDAGHWGEFETQPDGSRRRQWVFTDPRHPRHPSNRQSGEFPDELDTESRSPAPRERLDKFSQNRGRGRTPPAPAISLDRRKALEALREHLKVIAFHCPGFWLRATLMTPEGVTIRMSHKKDGFEETVAVTRQSDKLLAAVNRPDFRNQLIDELIHQGFPLGGGQSS